jgi:5-formyltetrahydrofolate cyclo-ligase
MTDLADKPALRRAAEANRRMLRQALPQAGLVIAQHFSSNMPMPAGSTIAGYIATRDEADPGPLMDAMRAGGNVIALPRVAGPGTLSFHAWQEGAIPVSGSFKLLEPAADWPEVTPDIVLVPLLAFDARGYRLGYGGGFYDRSLQRLRRSGSVVAVGIGFSGQEMAELPADAHDEKLDWIVTELGARRFT